MTRSGGLSGQADRTPVRAIERPYRVRFEEVTGGGTIRPALFLAYAQDCAWQHSALLGYDRDWYDAHGIFWLVRAVALDVLHPVTTYSDIVVTTEVIGFRRATARRHTDVRDRTGIVAASADIDWLLLNGRGMPARIPPAFDELFGAEGATFEITRVPLPPPSADAFERRFDVRRRDLDQMDPVNNSVYVDYLEETLEAAGLSALLGTLPRRYVMEYVGAAERGHVLVARLWPSGAGWSYRLAREDGAELFRAQVSVPDLAGSSSAGRNGASGPGGSGD